MKAMKAQASAMNLNSLEAYILKIDDLEFVATQRNRILTKKHGRLPAYSLWDAASIQNETRVEKITWFIEHLPYLDYFSEISNKFVGSSSETA
tara:strand:+ start:6184 stop:6462 length:279 start_codon:yes stop_codon:yes gene_type:complete